MCHDGHAHTHTSCVHTYTQDKILLFLDLMWNALAALYLQTRHCILFLLEPLGKWREQDHMCPRLIFNSLYNTE